MTGGGRGDWPGQRRAMGGGGGEGDWDNSNRTTIKERKILKKFKILCETTKVPNSLSNPEEEEKS